MWGPFCHLRSHRAQPNPICGLLSLGSNQLPLATVQVEARSRKLGSDLLGRVQDISPKSHKRFPGLCGQLLDEDQTRLLVLARRSPRLGRIPGALTGYVERVRPLRCPQQDHSHTLLLKGTSIVNSSSVRLLRTRPRWLGRSCGENRWCRGKD